MAIGLQLLVQLGDARGEGFADETLSGFDRRSHPMGALVRLPQHVARPGEVALIGGQCHAPCESCRETQRRSPDGCGKAQCGCHSGGYGLIWVRLFWSDLIVPVRNCPATICGGGRGMAGVLQPATTCSNSSRDRPNTPAASLLLLRIPLAPLLSHVLVPTPTNVAGRSPSNNQVRHKTPGHTRRRPHSRGAAPRSFSGGGRDGHRRTARQRPERRGPRHLVRDRRRRRSRRAEAQAGPCLLYTSDAADDLLCVDLGGRRIIKKKKTKKHN